MKIPKTFQGFAPLPPPPLKPPADYSDRCAVVFSKWQNRPANFSLFRPLWIFFQKYSTRKRILLEICLIE